MNCTFGRVALWTGPTVVASTVEATADSMNSRRVTFGDMRAVYIRLVFQALPCRSDSDYGLGQTRLR